MPPLTRLVDLDADRCLAIAYRITRDLAVAEDAVHQALISAWRELPRLREVDRYEMWLQRLLINACYQELRQLRRWKERVVPLAARGAGRGGPLPVRGRARRARSGIRAALPDRRAIFVLHHHAGLPSRPSPRSSTCRSGQ